MSLKRSISLVGLLLIIVGCFVDYLAPESGVNILGISNLLAILSIGLVCSDNKNLQFFGIAFCGLIGVHGIEFFFLSETAGESMVALGKVSLLLNPILYYIQKIILSIKNWNK